MTKFNGFEEVPLTIPHLKQIAGRAGRYKSAHDANQEAERASKGTHEGSGVPISFSRIVLILKFVVYERRDMR